jgi:PhnB protein
VRGRPTFQGFALSLTPSGETEARRLFTVLSEGGHVHMPLTRTFFSPCFGMVADRFGVSWMIHVTTGAAARGEELARRFEAKAQDAATW